MGGAVVVVGGAVVVVGGAVVVVVAVVGGEVVPVMERVVVVELIVVNESPVVVVVPPDAEIAPMPDAVAGSVGETLVSSATSPEAQAMRINTKTPSSAARLAMAVHLSKQRANLSAHNWTG